jgi:hypothetical protein
MDGTRLVVVVSWSWFAKNLEKPETMPQTGGVKVG